MIVNGFSPITGDVSDIMYEPEYRLKHYFPVGDTDSEYLFCYIMDNLNGLGSSAESLIKISKLIVRLAKTVSPHGKLNFLLSNGEYIFAYMNKPETPHYLLRHPPHKGYAKLMDEDFEVRLESIKAPNEYAAIIATEPLTNEEWRAFKPRTLYVFHHGNMIMKVSENGKIKHTTKQKGS